MVKRSGQRQKPRGSPPIGRIHVLSAFFFILWGIILIQLFRVQVIEHGVFVVQAQEQYMTIRKVQSKRGEIFWQDISADELVPLVVNKPVYHLYIAPKYIDNSESFALIVSNALAVRKEDIATRASKKNDPYELILQNLSDEAREGLEQVFLEKGLVRQTFGFEERIERYYVENNLAAHVTGFLGFTEDGTSRLGQYGLEEYFEKTLKGSRGIILGDKDVSGRPISIGRRIVERAIDGRDVIVTLDKNIQYRTCNLLAEYIDRYDAKRGLVVIMNPMNGKVYALCARPDFNPNAYSDAPASSFINAAISEAYEPGSIFKPITFAAAIESGTMTPLTTYVDTGSVTIDRFTIRNAGGRSFGVSTMIDVLDKSINTGAIFAMRTVGPSVFRKYVEKFGFGKLTGIELAGEVTGNVSPLEKGNEIYAATASFGQGITVTPLQMLTAFSAIARGGTLVKPSVVEKVIGEEGVEVTGVVEGDRVISSETSETLRLMMVSTIENGYSKKARVPGYAIAGKSGTAEIPNKDSLGYSEETIHSFIGFGPVDKREPVFTMLVKLDQPTTVRFSSDSAAPLFAEIAKFLLDYLEVPPSL